MTSTAGRVAGAAIDWLALLRDEGPAARALTNAGRQLGAGVAMVERRQLTDLAEAIHNRSGQWRHAIDELAKLAADANAAAPERAAAQGALRTMRELDLSSRGGALAQLREGLASLRPLVGDLAPVPELTGELGRTTHRYAVQAADGTLAERVRTASLFAREGTWSAISAPGTKGHPATEAERLGEAIHAARRRAHSTTMTFSDVLIRKTPDGRFSTGLADDLDGIVNVGGEQPMFNHTTRVSVGRTIGEGEAVELAGVHPEIVGFVGSPSPAHVRLVQPGEWAAAR